MAILKLYSSRVAGRNRLLLLGQIELVLIDRRGGTQALDLVGSVSRLSSRCCVDNFFEVELSLRK